jgi:hypothetical protein
MTSDLQTAGLELTYTAREAAALLGRSYSWLDQRSRRGEFERPDGTVVEPSRSPGGYRYFTVEDIQDIVTCCYRHRWYSFEELNAVLRQLATDLRRGALPPIHSTGANW